MHVHTAVQLLCVVACWAAAVQRAERICTHHPATPKLSFCPSHTLQVTLSQALAGSGVGWSFAHYSVLATPRSYWLVSLLLCCMQVTLSQALAGSGFGPALRTLLPKPLITYCSASARTCPCRSHCPRRWRAAALTPRSARCFPNRSSHTALPLPALAPAGHTVPGAGGQRL